MALRVLGVALRRRLAQRSHLDLLQELFEERLRRLQCEKSASALRETVSAPARTVVRKRL